MTQGGGYDLGTVYRALAVGAVAVGSKAAMIAKSAGGIKGLSAAILAAGMSLPVVPSCSQAFSITSLPGNLKAQCSCKTFLQT